MADNLIGFELLLRCSKQDIKKKEDLLMLLVHHCLLKNGFKCAGTGEEWKDDVTPSEILPNGWNTSKEYSLRYKRDEAKFVLMSNRTDDVIVFNFTSPEQMKVSNVMFNVEECVKALDGDMSEMLPTCQNVAQKITQSLVTPYAVVQKRDTNTQTAEERTPNVRADPFYHRNLVTDVDLRNMNAVGRRDLDPLAAMGGGGGMLFDPLRESRNRLLGDIGVPQRLPRGAVPPHARFDPFGPPDNDIRGRPPPGYDDMFG